MVESWWITQAADYVSSFCSNSCICHCLIRDQKHTLHGAGVPIALAVMWKWEAFSFHFYGFSTLRGHSPAGWNSVFIELGTWHLLGLSCGGRGQRDRAILGTCFAECVVCGQGMVERWGNDGDTHITKQQGWGWGITKAGTLTSSNTCCPWHSICEESWKGNKPSWPFCLHPSQLKEQEEGGKGGKAPELFW